MPMGGERSENATIEDFKEGLYLGEDHPSTSPYVLAKYPTFGQNILPDQEVPRLRNLVKEYTIEVVKLGNRMMDLVSLSLGLPEKYIQEHITKYEPVQLPRIFHYPAQSSVEDDDVVHAT